MPACLALRAVNDGAAARIFAGGGFPRHWRAGGGDGQGKNNDGSAGPGEPGMADCIDVHHVVTQAFGASGGAAAATGAGEVMAQEQAEARDTPSRPRQTF